MADLEKINKINTVVQNYFTTYPSIDKIPAKDLMPNFIKAGIFDKDHRAGLPIRKLVRDLDEKKQLALIPSILAERKKVNTNWYFIQQKI
jgi:hypothetical protein